MRYRAKFGALGWCWSGSACLVLVLWLDGLRSGTAGFLFLFFILMALQRVLSYVFIYWDLGVEELRERRIWSTRSVPWNEVTHIGRWTQNSNYIIVDHSRLEPLSDRGRMVANPDDEAGFIAALRRYATQAEIEL